MISQRKADILVFCLVYDSLTKMAKESPDPKVFQDILNDGDAALRINIVEYRALVTDAFVEISERYSQKTKFNAMVTATKPSTFALRTAALIEALLGRLGVSHEDLTREFTQKMTPVIRDLAFAARQESPAARLTSLSMTPFSSSWVQGFSWVRKAIQNAVPDATSTFEEAALADAMAVSIGEDIQSANNVLKVDPENARAKKQRKSSLKNATEFVSATGEGSAKAISSALKTSGYVTQIGKRLKLSPDKEACLTLRGKGIIAAGAGSGKTMAMAAKVVYAIDELGFKPSEIIATSFTRKASRELQERIVKYGNENIIKGSERTVGATTHVVAIDLLRQNGISFSILSGPEMDALIRTAIAQVGMNPSQDGSLYLVERKDPYGRDLNRTLDDERNTLNKLRLYKEQDQQWDLSEDPELQSLQQKMTQLLSGIETGSMKVWVSSYGISMPANAVPANTDEWKYVNAWTNKLKQFRARLGDVENPGDLAQGELQAMYEYLNKKTFNNFLNPPKSKRATEEEKKPKRAVYSEYATRPANKWFNLGAKEDIDERKLVGTIGRFKSSGISPEMALQKEEDLEMVPYIAAYAAYEFLRNNDNGINPGGLGFDDILLRTVRLLATDDTFRNKVQSQIKVVVVDEAQDLNDVQHKMFGLIAGALDPKTLAFREDGKMTADTYTMIGDDFQCVDGDAIVRVYSNGEFQSQEKKVRDVVAGDSILSYSGNHLPVGVPGFNVYNRVRRIQKSDWETSLEIVTVAGHRLRMSPNHKLWADIPTDIPSYDFDKNTFDGKYYDSLADAVAEYGEVPSKLTLSGKEMSETVADNLRPGMFVPVFDNGFKAVEILEINKIPQGDLWDLDVENSMNFVANGILTHNSIYAFRGSDPSTFIENSDVKGGPFKTVMLTTNYRSTRKIVEAGNAIIAHNEGQLPKVCTVPQDKEDGVIVAVETDTFEDSCGFIAKDIATSVKTGGESYSAFGIGARTNAEIDSILLSLIEQGIPFKSRRNPFKSGLYVTLTRWLELSDYASLPKAAVNEIVESAHVGGPFFLDRKFQSNLRTAARGENFLEFILGGGQVYEGNQEWRNDYVRIYGEALKDVIDFGSRNPKTSEMLNRILAVKGVKGRTFGQQILKSRQVEEEDVVDAATQEEGVDSIQDVIAPIYRLAKNIDDISSCVRYLREITVKANSLKTADEEQKPAVTVDTIHSWKGLECDHMFVMMQPGIFPHSRTTTPEGLQEERRLAYVAVTRGRNQVTILMPDENMRGKNINAVDPKQRVTKSPYAAEACIPSVRA